MGINGKIAKIGDAIFSMLKAEPFGYSVLAEPGMDATKIQPEPLLNQNDPSAAVTYQIDAITPVYVKTGNGAVVHGQPAYEIVDFTILVHNRDYENCCNLASAVIEVLVLPTTSSSFGTTNTFKINGVSLESLSEDYNRQRKYYTKTLTFQARVL